MRLNHNNKFLENVSLPHREDQNYELSVILIFMAQLSLKEGI